jgi:hypothetical protein
MKVEPTNSETNRAQPLPSSSELLLNELLRRTVDDWAHIDDIVDVIRHYARVEEPSVARAVAIEVVGKALTLGLAEAGTTKGGFSSYPATTAMQILDCEWPSDHFPRLGDFPFWLNLTPKGLAWLRIRGLTW